MNQQKKPRVATFFLAAATALGAGMQTMRAQQPLPQQAPIANSNYNSLNSQSIDFVASRGPLQWYQYVGEGFRQERIPQTGEWIGIEFTPDGFVPYDLNNPQERFAYNDLQAQARNEQWRINNEFSVYGGYNPYCYDSWGHGRLIIGGVFVLGFSGHRDWGLYGPHFGHTGGFFFNERRYSGFHERIIENRPGIINHPTQQHFVPPAHQQSRGSFGGQSPHPHC